MNGERYFVQVQHRPRRVAFLVDVDHSTDALFNEIVDFNVSSWGGRHNPIIPLLDGQIPESYWPLLDVANPDLLYTYGELSTDVIRRIVTDIRPMDVLKHNASFQPEKHKFRVRIDHQATVAPVLSRIMERFPVFVRKPEPAIMVFEYNDIRTVSAFVQRNFGANTSIHIWCRDQRIPSVTVPPGDAEVMKALAGNANLVAPIAICAEAPLKVKASTQDWGTALTVCYGISPWNFVEFWNSAYFQDRASGVAGSLSEVWMEPPLLEDSSFYEAFVELLRRRAFASEHQPYLRFISYDETKDRMREISKRICTDLHWSMHSSEPIVRSKGELPSFERRSATSFFAPQSSRPRLEQLSGDSPFLDLSPPVDVGQGRDEHWIAEFAVENPRQERRFVNKAAWWKLPRKDRLGNLFFPHSPSRVGNDYLISVEVSGQQQGVQLNIPDLARLFGALLLPEAAPEWARRLDSAIRDNRDKAFYIRSSDKGKYAHGVLDLFESLQKAAYVFEHIYWGHVIESLSSTVASHHTRAKVRNDFERMGVDILKSASGLDMIVDEVLDAAGRTQRPTQYINFDSLFHRYLAYVKALPDHDQIDEVTQTDPRRSGVSDENGIRKAARANLRDMLSDMTARKLFLQGAEIQCDYCLASLWYHVDDLRSVVTCRGCRREVNLPAEIQWSYALNELVASAVRDHGVAPVIRTAFRLFADSRECFCFLPGIEVRDYSTDPETQVCELDLVWIRDGEFGIAEIKRTPRKFSVRGDLASILGAALPNRYLLVSASGTEEQMAEARLQVQSQISHDIAVETWNPEIFRRSARPGWNTVAYSVFP
jgi:hypothetical protein